MKTNARHTFSAIEIKTSADIRYYVTALPVSVMIKVCHVSRADEDPKKGFQRLLNTSRLKAIAEYLDAGKVIPGSLILSAHPGAELRFNSARGELSFAVHPKSFFVIDGQHRLYGASEAKTKVTFPVSIMVGLSLEEEVQYFNDVNGEQRGVPRTLQLEIEKFSAPKESKDKIRIDLFHALNQRPDSPLCNRMSATKSVSGKLSHVPFKMALDPLLDQKPLSVLSFDDKVKVLINFVKGVESVLLTSLSSSERLFNAAFFQALFGAFKLVAVLTYERHKNYDAESFQETLKPLENIQWDKHAGTNRQAIAGLTKHIVDLIC